MNALEEQRKQLLAWLFLADIPAPVFSHLSQSYLFMNLRGANK